jgi:hypothetical protein
VSLEAVVRHYIKHYRPSSERELGQFRNQTSDEAAVTMAALAEDTAGRRFSHQRRIKQAALEAARRRLAPATSDLAKQPTFGTVLRLIERLLEPVSGVGVLYKYDTALRIGARFGRLPQEVHLHAGTRVGAAALGLDADQRFLYLREFPAELQVVPPHEVEDILCIYKQVLADAKLGKPVPLPDDDRCYLDNPEDFE